MKILNVLKITTFSFLVASMFFLAGCTKQERTAAGALIGAGTGALVGSAAGGTGGGVAGAAIGGVTGAIIGNSSGGN